MNQDRTSANFSAELHAHALGFVVKMQGSWSDQALAQFRHFLSLGRLSPAQDEMLAALRQARAKYFEGENHLFICGAQPCCATIGFDFSDAAFKAVSQELGIPISKTGCQGACKQAPVLTLRVGDRNEMFAQVLTEKDWETVLEFVQRAAHAGTLLVDAAGAERFRYDPVHDHAKPGAHLQPVQFLVGHFRGEGTYGMTPYKFQKEVIGTWEAGGRFIALRMDAAYPLADGGKDVHRALVIVGSAPSSGKITAHAYTDAGLIRQYSIERGLNHLQFDDVPPGHGNQWKRARKILSSTPKGFEERLEVDVGDGRFVPYYYISMYRTAR